MAYHDGQRFVDAPPQPYTGYPGWLDIDCGCCAGLEWGGLEPRECRDCNGSGGLAYHIESGVYALYPGGPLRGRNVKKP